MAKQSTNNYAFIDGQNLNLATRQLGWKLDLKKFRVYLREKYQVEKAYYFIGFVETNAVLYTALQEAGYILIFKPTLIHKDGTMKGNCDAELVLQAMIDYKQYDKAIIVTGDGDFTCLINYLRDSQKLKTILIPDKQKYSSLLRKAGEGGNYLVYMNGLKRKLEHIQKKRTP